MQINQWGTDAMNKIYTYLLTIFEKNWLIFSDKQASESPSVLHLKLFEFPFKLVFFCRYSGSLSCLGYSVSSLARDSSTLYIAFISFHEEKE